MKTIAIPFLLLAMLSTCKKEPDTRRIPDGTKVWLNSKVNYTDFKDHGTIAKPPFIIIGLTAQSTYSMNFYHVADSNSPVKYWDIQDNVLQLHP